jgi:hypothetical protein
MLSTLQTRTQREVLALSNLLYLTLSLWMLPSNPSLTVVSLLVLLFSESLLQAR